MRGTHDVAATARVRPLSAYQHALDANQCGAESLHVCHFADVTRPVRLGARLVGAREWFGHSCNSLRRILRRRILPFQATQAPGRSLRWSHTSSAVVDALFGIVLLSAEVSLHLWRGLSPRLKLLGSATTAQTEKPAPDLRYRVLLHLLYLVARRALPDHALRTRLFEAGERMGIHVLPVHFYSPVPVVHELSGETWLPYDLKGIDWREDEQRALVHRLSRWAPEFAELVDNSAEHPFAFPLNNPAFGRTDAALYYSIIREFKPGQILEVGGGYSTLLSTAAAARNGTTIVDCVEPFPMPVLRQNPNGLRRLIEQPVQQVPLDEFTRLGPGDILFIDCSHVARIGSDVNHLLLRVLPHLQDGVIVHVHDIFLPDEYPRTWVTEQKLFWSEQYVLHAFLLFNTTFRVLCSAHFLGKHFPLDVVNAFPLCVPPGGGSLWFQRQPAPSLL